MNSASSVPPFRGRVSTWVHRDRVRRPYRTGAPGHSVDETFAQRVAVIDQNKAAGVPDALSSLLPRFTPLPVC
ncbi:MAG TPA: hypothetical protein VKZ53_16855 [Candidatus Angelobacter sp.]|nr:hypothetical protein [Candidatus Angelobacter sp.]